MTKILADVFDIRGFKGRTIAMYLEWIKLTITWMIRNHIWGCQTHNLVHESKIIIGIILNFLLPINRDGHQGEYRCSNRQVGDEVVYSTINWAKNPISKEKIFEILTMFYSYSNVQGIFWWVPVSSKKLFAL